MSELLPNELIVNPTDKSVEVTPALEKALPHIHYAFEEHDKAFGYNELFYLDDLKSSVSDALSPQGKPVTMSVLHPENAKLNEALLLFAPFSDGAPTSTPIKLYRYITETDKNESYSKTQAAPNSWNQITKSAVTCDVLSAMGKNIPVVTIFSPIPTGNFDRRQRQAIASGDFRAIGDVAYRALLRAQVLLNGRHASTQIEKLHIAGASLGAHNALGASRQLQQHYDIQSVTLQELITGQQSLATLGRHFTVQPETGEVSQVVSDATRSRIAEPLMRRLITANGNELATQIRMVNGASKLSYMRGLTNDRAVATALEAVASTGTRLTVAVANNSTLTQGTEKYVPDAYRNLIRLLPEAGHKLGHIADEYVALSSIVLALGITRH